jgi:hypothetical protein
MEGKIIAVGKGKLEMNGSGPLNPGPAPAPAPFPIPISWISTEPSSELPPVNGSTLRWR